MEPVKFTKEQSSLIESFQYDESSWALDVLMHNGNGYTYSDVPPEVYSEFVNAPSKGSFYNKSIKGNYESLNHKDLPAEMPKTIEGDFKEQLKASVAEDDGRDPSWPPEDVTDAIMGNDALEIAGGLSQRRKETPMSEVAAKWRLEDDALEIAGGVKMAHASEVGDWVEPEVMQPEVALVTVGPLQEVMGKLSAVSKTINSLMAKSRQFIDRSFVVTDRKSYDEVQATVKSLKLHGAEIVSVIDPIRETFYRAYNTVQTKQKEAIDPLNAAMKVANLNLNAYDQRMDNEARERQRVADAEANRIAEEARRAESVRLTLAAADDHFAVGETAAAERLFEEPIEAPAQPVYSERVYSEAPIVQGVSKRKNWGGEIVDLEALILDVAAGIEHGKKNNGNLGGHAPSNFLMGNATAINQACKALEANAKFPGIVSKNNAVRSTRV